MYAFRVFMFFKERVKMKSFPLRNQKINLAYLPVNMFLVDVPNLSKLVSISWQFLYVFWKFVLCSSISFVKLSILSKLCSSSSLTFNDIVELYLCRLVSKFCNSSFIDSMYWSHESSRISTMSSRTSDIDGTM